MKAFAPSLMKKLFMTPNKLSSTKTVSLSSLASLLTEPISVQFVQQFHARYIINGLHQNASIAYELINLYSLTKNHGYSQRILDTVTNPTLILFNTIIRNHSNNGLFDEILQLYRRIFVNSMYPDEFAFPFVLKSCSYVLAFQYGEKIHSDIVKLGYESFVFVSSALLHLYLKAGKLVIARNLFDEIPERNLISWNTMIEGCNLCGDANGAFSLFREMREKGISPDYVTMTCMLRACIKLGCLQLGLALHCVIVLNDLEGELTIGTGLVAMYTKFGSLEMGRRVFERMHERDVVSWNAMIGGYNQNNLPVDALNLFREMEISGIKPDHITVVMAIIAVAEMRAVVLGKQLHAHSVRNCIAYEVTVQNSLIDMYSKCGDLEKSHLIFEKLSNKTVVSWSCIVQGYVRHERSVEALALYAQMMHEGMRPDSITLVNVLPACVSLGALQVVKNIHCYMTKYNLDSLTSLVTSLLVSYTKLGCIEAAQELFHRELLNRDRDVVAYNAMIGAYAMNGNWIMCKDLFAQMKREKVRPDHVTFLGLLSACAHLGILFEGWDIFNGMSLSHGCEPQLEHYACMVNLLGRKGNLEEALRLIETMPFETDSRIWGALLSACKVHKDTNIAEFAAEELLKREPSNAGNYVLLSNIYASAGKWEKVAKLRAMLKNRGLRKNTGFSWLEMRGRVHAFSAGDQSHSRSEDIYSILDALSLQIKEEEAWLPD
ncbi:pentatricopeptide repeat-containing protein At4g35130, chloroplastic [Amborella trichopoda]|uniref:Pentacotripeptide-repeat region of PRORP domain-containing protein n=1 Tax=Amborella trichopoda TaxID=13333 RepID=W1NWZ5_AMBTC|nr:pentatricopeptide repeat-containing protein At4g35130, chloroplastic [Amborella trichopoda]ERM99184.1 hypothetical protein AMTR_s00092p00078040 [Amborella trichopoda]|eukprot:XP_006836331.3 pentatricopeptide repeat-containing protein At4g35130, chloroplastic [Amborella trichopoda]